MEDNDTLEREIKQISTVQERASGADECIDNLEMKPGKHMLQKYITANGGQLWICVNCQNIFNQETSPEWRLQAQTGKASWRKDLSTLLEQESMFKGLQPLFGRR